MTGGLTMEYRATYKCRLCGAKFIQDSAGERNALKHITEMAVSIRGGILPQITVITPHCCGGDHAGSLGLADFLGWEKEK